jgi:RNA polymerase-associated protein RTF1
VRLLVGVGEDKVQKYRVAQVVDVVDYHRAYKLGTTMTKKALRLKHGKAEKVFLMDIISNGDFTDVIILIFLYIV